jgi:putative CocE/NonD family hydrolase
VAAIGRYEISEKTDIVIPMPDGARLAASGFFPVTPEPRPVVISCYPYHKDDLVGAFFDHPRRLFASHGFVDLLVDFRGTGASDGYCWDTFDVENEGRDGAAVVEWAGQQEWSDGNVGIWGMSYGGMTSLNVASRRPSHLKAALPLFATPNIYRDLVCPGGIPNALGNSVRETYMLAMDMVPPTLQDPEGRWRRLWEDHLRRLSNGDVWSLSWADHQAYDAHWQARTTDLEQIEVPTFMIGGWNDIFPEGMTEPFQRIPSEKKLVMGPWLHQMPHQSPVEPWDWMAEALAWWNRWLLDDEAGAEAAEPVRLFFQGEDRWYGFEQWPPPQARAVTWHLGPDGTLDQRAPDEETSTEYVADLTFGAQGFLLDPTGTGLGFPLEQSADVAKAAAFVSEPLTEDLQIAGNARATLAVTLLDGDALDLCVKIVDLAPGGASTHVATGWLNGEHRADPSVAQPVAQGVEETYAVDLWATAYTIPAGHRLGVLVACTDFPHSFAPRTRPTIAIRLGGQGGSAIAIPALSAQADAVAIARPGAETPPPATLAFVKGAPHWRIENDLSAGGAGGGAMRVSYGGDYEFALAEGASFALAYGGTAHTSNLRPDGMRVTGRAEATVRSSAGEVVEIRVRSVFTRHTTVLSASLAIDGATSFEKSWSNTDRSAQS